MIYSITTADGGQFISNQQQQVDEDLTRKQVWWGSK